MNPCPICGRISKDPILHADWHKYYDNREKRSLDTCIECGKLGKLGKRGRYRGLCGSCRSEEFKK